MRNESPIEEDELKLQEMLDQKRREDRKNLVARRRAHRAKLQVDEVMLAKVEVMAKFLIPQEVIAHEIELSPAKFRYMISVDHELFNEELGAAYWRGRGNGISILSMRQWTKAMEGDTQMLIHLGNYAMRQKFRAMDEEEIIHQPQTDEKEVLVTERIFRRLTPREIDSEAQ